MKSEYYVARESLPEWVCKGQTQFHNQHAGPAETAKDILFHFTTIGYDFNKLMEADSEFCARLTPQVIWNWTNALSDNFLSEMKSIGKNLIQVPWSVGFSTDSEAIQRKVVTEFTQKAHRSNIKICAYFSLTNIFWKDAYEKEPFLKDLTARFSDGKTVLYGYSQARHLACINHPEWLDYLAAKVKSAIIEGKVDAIYFDNLSATCRCDICQSLFGDFTEKHSGTRYEIPVLKQYYPANVKQEVEVEVELSEKAQSESDTENRSRDYLWKIFQADRITKALLYLREFAFKLKYPLGFSANNHLLHFVNDVCNIIYSQDTKLPGETWSNIPYLRYLEGDCDSWKQQITNHPLNGHDPRLSMAEAMAFQSYPYNAVYPDYNCFYSAFPELFSEIANMSEIAVIQEHPKRHPYYLQPLGFQNYQYEVIILSKWHNADFNKYKVIILPDLEAIDTELRNSLETYEQNGGKVIMTGMNRYVNDFGNIKYNIPDSRKRIDFNDKMSDDILAELNISVGEKLIEIESDCLLVVNVLQKNNSKEVLTHIVNYSKKTCGPVIIKLRNDIVFSKAEIYSPDGKEYQKVSFDKNCVTIEKLHIYSIIKLF